MNRYSKAANKQMFLKEQKKMMTGLRQVGIQLCASTSRSITDLVWSSSTGSVTVGKWRWSKSAVTSLRICDWNAGRRKTLILRLTIISTDHSPHICSIFERLRGLGWGNEIKKLNKWNPAILSSHPLIKQPKALTDRSEHLHANILYIFLTLSQFGPILKLILSNSSKYRRLSVSSMITRFWWNNDENYSFPSWQILLNDITLKSFLPWPISTKWMISNWSLMLRPRRSSLKNMNIHTSTGLTPKNDERMASGQRYRAPITDPHLQERH